MPDAYCRACHAMFPRPLPAPYGGICPDCIARGHIVTLIDVPRSRRTGRDRQRGDTGPPPERGRPSRTKRPSR